jgi:hypothetical protein
MSNPTLRRGHHPDGWVEYLQRLLNEDAAQSIVEEDDKFGEGTEQAVKDFQEKKGLKIDGVVGDHTWAALTGEPAEAETAHHGHHGHHAQADPEFDLAFTGPGEYHADKDELHFTLLVVSDNPIPVGDYNGQMDVERPDGSYVKMLDLQPVAGPGLAHKDTFVTGIADGLKADFGSGTHSYRAYLPSELGPSGYNGEFTIP